MANALNVDPRELKNMKESDLISKEMKLKAKDLDIMVDMMKEKIKVSPRKVQVQVLTMTPSSWKVRQTAEFFGVSNYMV